LQYEYLWADGVKYKKPVRLSAPEYVDKLFDWIEDQVRCRRQQDRIHGGQYGSTGCS
jgi:MOB kinase activator 1